MFAGFSGTTGLSDFPAPFIVGVRPWTSRHGLRRHPPQAKLGSPGFLARCFRTCSGSATAQGPVTPRDIGVPGVAFRILLRRRHPIVIAVRGSIPGPHVPLSTLHPRSCERRRMTRGRRGSLTLRRMTLSSTTTLPVLTGAPGVQNDTQRTARARGVSRGEPVESHAARFSHLTQTGRPRCGPESSQGAAIRYAILSK